MRAVLAWGAVLVVGCGVADTPEVFPAIGTRGLTRREEVHDRGRVLLMGNARARQLAAACLLAREHLAMRLEQSCRHGLSSREDLAADCSCTHDEQVAEAPYVCQVQARGECRAELDEPVTAVIWRATAVDAAPLASAAAAFRCRGGSEAPVVACRCAPGGAFCGCQAECRAGGGAP